MKVRITATLTYETDLEPDWYAPDGPKTEDEIIAWEVEQATNEDPEADTTLLDALIFEGEISDFKIEKVEEPAQVEDTQTYLTKASA